MYSYMTPKAVTTYYENMAKDFTFESLDSAQTFVESNIKAFDKFTGQVFATYTSKVVSSFKDINENAKEIIRTGKVKYPTCSGCGK